ncbi:hypothetical protein [Deinococcus sp. UYEF24]
MTKITARWMITLLALGFSCAALAEGGGAIGGGGWGIKGGNVTSQATRH